MTADEVKEWLEKHGRTSQWLAAAAGYKPTSIYNAISQNRFTEKLEAAILRAFTEEDRRADVDTEKPDASIWDLVLFSGSEVNTISRAKAAGGYQDLPTLYHDAVMSFADGILEREAKEAALAAQKGLAIVGREREDATRFWIDLHGGIAAGSQISSQVVPEPIPVERQYPADHYALRVFGQSMEPTIMDGSTIIVRALTNGGYPRKGTIVVYSDGMGSTLKEFGYREAKAGEETDRFGKVPVLRSINPEFSEVQTLEGGKIDAVYIETL